jgi:hypothetical protein
MIVEVFNSYQTVAASQTNAALSAGGASSAGKPGDYLAGVLVVPATTSPAAITIKDGSGSAITIFAGGADSVSNLVPFPVPIGARSKTGGWSITTGANLSVVAIGNFS